MTGWHAVVPIKPVAERKMRLRGHLNDRQVETLTEEMLHHVVTMLRSISSVSNVSLLSESPHPDWPIGWFADRGGGLNTALREVAALVPAKLLIVHADLPALAGADVEALVEGAATSGAAIAPDRHGVGTNGLALTDAAGFAFAFGLDSFARHRASLPDAAVIQRRGLAIDIDLPADLALVEPATS